eukprot:COSAG01_NODE_25764_length_734_cov_0.760630_1_plen_201_part_10
MPPPATAPLRAQLHTTTTARVNGNYRHATDAHHSSTMHLGAPVTQGKCAGATCRLVVVVVVVVACDRRRRRRMGLTISPPCAPARRDAQCIALVDVRAPRSRRGRAQHHIHPQHPRLPDLARHLGFPRRLADRWRFALLAEASPGPGTRCCRRWSSGVRATAAATVAASTIIGTGRVVCVAAAPHSVSIGASTTHRNGPVR